MIPLLSDYQGGNDFMSQKIIRPEGMELVEYLNDGYAICNR